MTTRGKTTINHRNGSPVVEFNPSSPGIAQLYDDVPQRYRQTPSVFKSSSITLAGCFSPNQAMIEELRNMNSCPLLTGLSPNVRSPINVGGIALEGVNEFLQREIPQRTMGPLLVVIDEPVLRGGMRFRVTSGKDSG
jgi:hypothetical protein